MRRLVVCIVTFVVVIAVVSGLSISAQAAVITFFGEDLNFTDNPSTPADDPLRPASLPNADGARDAFLANLVGVTTENFESLAPGATTPLTLTFGADTATLLGTAHVLDVPTGIFNGTYPISGSKFLLQLGPVGSFQINFSSPQASFGFYATDVGDGAAQLMWYDGSKRTPYGS